MDPTRVHDYELLYRAVKKTDPDSFINNEPCAALFIDKRGTSVDRDGDRNEKAIIESFKERFNRGGKTDNYRATVKILAKTCRNIGTCPLPKKTKTNRYHAEIWDSENTVEISLLKAIKLAKQCQVV